MRMWKRFQIGGIILLLIISILVGTKGVKENDEYFLFMGTSYLIPPGKWDDMGQTYLYGNFSLRIELLGEQDLSVHVFNKTEFTKWSNNESAIGYHYENVQNANVTATILTTLWYYFIIVLDNTHCLNASKSGTMNLYACYIYETPTELSTTIIPPAITHDITLPTTTTTSQTTTPDTSVTTSSTTSTTTPDTSITTPGMMSIATLLTIATLITVRKKKKK